MLGQLSGSDRIANQPRGLAVAESRQQVLRRGAVRLGEHDIESQGRDPGIDQPRHHFRDDDTRPGPLAIPCQGFIIDIHDQNRKVGIDPGRKPLIVVEDSEPELLQQHRVMKPERAGE